MTTAVTIAPTPILAFLNNQGQPCVGGSVLTQVGGVNTATYQDSAGTIALPNPIPLNNRGEISNAAGVSCQLFLATGVTYVFTLFDAGSNQLNQASYVTPVASSGALIAFQAALLSTTGGGLIGLDPTLNYTVATLGQHLADDAWNPRDFPWLAKFDGVTDDTAAINACATASRAGSRSIQLPAGKTAKVSASLNFSGLHVIGLGGINQIHLQATSAQFDVITTTGNSTFVGIYVNGGWDGTTAGQTGNTFSVNNGTTGFPYNVHFRDCVIQNSKSRGIYIQNGGYSSLWNVKCNASGLHGLDLFGNSAIAACTTITVGGNSIFSDCPNGYGVNITECISITFHGVIMENTKGVQINGNDNRAISFDTVYLENTAGSLFVTSTGSGIGLSFVNCYGGGAVLPYFSTWQEVYFRGNSNLGESAVPFANRILTAGINNQVTTSAVSFTATSIALPSGTWQVWGILQTINATSATITRAGATLTTNVADPGISSGVNPVIFGADEMEYNPGANADIRLQPFDIFQNTTAASLTVYMRAQLGVTAGTIAYGAAIKAVKVS